MAKERQVFVAYSYRTYPKADYRRVFNSLEREYDVRFIFADEKITNMHIMQKIVSYIRSSDLCLFDISGWNPNVTLELGYAMATQKSKWYIAVNPKKTKMKEVPSDLRGIDRIQYESYDELGTKVSALIEQTYEKRPSTVEDYILGLRAQLLAQFKKKDGFNINEIATLLGVEIRVAQLVVEPLVDVKLRTQGQKKGTRYFRMQPGPIPKRVAKA